jgi:hypothetical protein
MSFIIKYKTSSILLEDFRFILFSREYLKVSQSIKPWVREGFCDLFEGVELIVRKTAGWSEPISFKLVVVLSRLFDILVMNISRMLGFFLRRLSQNVSNDGALSL